MRAQPASQHLQRRGDTGRQVSAPGVRLQRDKRETRPRSRRHPTAETGRHRNRRPSGILTDTRPGRHDDHPKPASQHLVSDRRDWETSGGHDAEREMGDKPGASVTASRHRETSGRHDPVTASGVRPQRLRDKRETQTARVTAFCI